MTIDKRRAVGDESRQHFFRNVVVIKIKRSSGDLVARREFMKLSQIVVTDQMCP